LSTEVASGGLDSYLPGNLFLLLTQKQLLIKARYPFGLGKLGNFKSRLRIGTGIAFLIVTGFNH